MKLLFVTHAKFLRISNMYIAVVSHTKTAVATYLNISPALPDAEMLSIILLFNPDVTMRLYSSLHVFDALFNFIVETFSGKTKKG